VTMGASGRQHCHRHVGTRGSITLSTVRVMTLAAFSVAVQRFKDPYGLTPVRKYPACGVPAEGGKGPGKDISRL